MIVPSIRTFSTSSNGAVTVPIRIQKCSAALVEVGITTSWPRVAISGAGIPPNQAQIRPLRGGEAPPPVPHEALSHSGVPKLVEVCGLFQVVLGIPPFSYPPSTITSELAPHGVAVAVAVGLAVAVAVAVAVALGLAVAVAVGVGLAVAVAVAVAVTVAVAVGVGVPQLWPSLRFDAVTTPVSIAAPSRIASVHVPLICAVLSPPKVTLSEVIGGGLV
jgi:hypothetical protein